jgi:tetratricopeptide (TPR) repeat protein
VVYTTQTPASGCQERRGCVGWFGMGCKRRPEREVKRKFCDGHHSGKAQICDARHSYLSRLRERRATVVTMVATMMARIFINYRRADATATAGRLYDRLAQTFGRKTLFMDVDHIPAGADFVEYLHSQVAACRVFLAVIGPNWLDAKDDDGRRRLDKPDDFVAIEIAAALSRDIRVIPVLVDGARMPKARDLPESLKPLARRQPIGLRHDHFGRDGEALVEKIREVLRDRSVSVNTWRAAAAAVAALLLVGWTSLFVTGMPISLAGSVQSDTRAQAEKDKLAVAKAEEERKTRAAAEAQRKAEEAKTPPLTVRIPAVNTVADIQAQRKAKETVAAAEAVAAAKADEERKAKDAAVAEAKRKSDEAERQQLAAGNPGQADGIGWLGVRTQKVTDEIAESLNIKPPRGALVASVDDRGPARPAGIERGDVIVTFDGKDIKDTSDLRPVISTTPVGKQTPVVVIRKGKEETKTVTVGRLPESMALARQGATASNDRDYDRAIALFSEAIQLAPDYASAFNSRGLAYSKKGDNDRAISDYNEAIRLDPHNSLAFSNRGWAYAGKGENDRAISDYNEAIRLDPHNSLAFNNRGNAYSKKGDVDRAISDYNEAIRLDPNNSLAFRNRGTAYSKKGENDRAISDYNEAIRLDPNNSLAFNNRGNAYSKKGDVDRAISDYNEAIRLDPNNSLAFRNRGTAYSKKGDKDRAISDYNEAIRLDP